MAVVITGNTALLRVVRRLMASNGAKREPRSCPDLGAFGSHFRRKPPIRANGLVRGELTVTQVRSLRSAHLGGASRPSLTFKQHSSDNAAPEAAPASFRGLEPPLCSMAGAASPRIAVQGRWRIRRPGQPRPGPGAGGGGQATEEDHARRPGAASTRMPLSGAGRLACFPEAAGHGPQTKRSLRIPTGPSSRPRCPV